MRPAGLVLGALGTVLPLVLSQLDVSWEWKPEMVWLVAAMVVTGAATGWWRARSLRRATEARSRRRVVVWCLTFPLALWSAYVATTAVWAVPAGEWSVGGFLDVLLVSLLYFVIVAYVPLLVGGTLVAWTLYRDAPPEQADRR